MLYFLVHLVHVGAHLFTLNLRREGDLTAEMVCEELQSKHLKGHSGPRVRHLFYSESQRLVLTVVGPERLATIKIVDDQQLS